MDLKKNFKPMLGSILVAIVLWVMVATNENYDYQVTVPIELVRLAPHRALYELVPEKALVEIRGKGRSLLVLWFYDLIFKLDLPDVKTSKTIDLEEYLNTLDIPTALNIEILGIIEPKTINLKVDELVEVKKPIRIAGNIGVEDGYTLIGYTCSPDSAQISGPKNLIRNIKELNTGILDFKTQTSRFDEDVNLVNPAPGLVKLETEIVTVGFDIQRLVERVIYDIPVHVINIPGRLVVESLPPKISLRIKGGEQIVAGINADEIQAEINFGKQYKVDREEYSAKIITPQNVNWIESIPKKFRLKIRRK